MNDDARLARTGTGENQQGAVGVRDGIDFCHTGTVRRVDADAIGRQLGDGTVVVLSPIGYSPTSPIA